MTIRRHVLTGAAACTLLLAGAAQSAGATTGIPQPGAARAAASWLAAKFNATGFIPTTSGKATLSATAQSVLALAAADTDLATARAGFAYLSAHVQTSVTYTGSDAPGKLALLMLDAEALGDNPDDVGGTNLVTALLGTEQTTGTLAGMFGTTAQLSTYLAGDYQQGLALASLAGAGVADATQAVRWLKTQQCADGGWTTLAGDSCTAPPDTFGGPSNTASALALEGLVSQKALTSSVAAHAVAFLKTSEDAHGGWSYLPAAATTPQTADPDSTAEVLQALVAAGIDPVGLTFVRDGVTPVQRLLSLQVTSGPTAGAFYYPTPTSASTPTAGTLLATYEAVPALAGLPIPFGPGGGGYWVVTANGAVGAFGGAPSLGSLSTADTSDVVAMASTPDGNGYWLVGSDGGVFAFGDAAYEGSLPALGVHVDDVVAIVPTSDGNGYWLVGSDGGVFAFGDAAYEGSLPALGEHVDDVVGAVPSSDGGGYLMVGADGGAFAFGVAFDGSLPGLGVHVDDVVSVVDSPGGYLMVGNDGGVFAFGSAAFEGSLPGLGVHVDDVVGLLATPGGGGYWMVGSDGGVFAFGDAPFGGSGSTGTVVGGAADLARPA